MLLVEVQHKRCFLHFLHEIEIVQLQHFELSEESANTLVDSSSREAGWRLTRRRLFSLA